MKTVFLKPNPWLMLATLWLTMCADIPTTAQIAAGAQTNKPTENESTSPERSSVIAQPLQWVRNDTYQIKYKVPSDWTQIRQQITDSLTHTTYISPDQLMVLTVSKRRGNVVKVTPRQWLEVLTSRFCLKEKLVFQTRYNRLTFWEATGFILQKDRVGRYEALVTVHKGNTISVYLEADCRLAYNRNQGIIYEVFSSVAPYRAGGLF